VLLRSALTFGLVAGLAPAAAATAHAQNNIDQGKSAAEIFAADCATCHKSVRGLAAGKNSFMLSSFLREHYTASRDQAAAMAAYVLSARGSEPAPRQKPETEHARATGEEPKSGEAKSGEPKSAARPTRASAKPEEEETRPAEGVSPTGAEKREPKPATATREEKKPEEAAPAQEPGPVIAAPAVNQAPNSTELPEVGPTRSAAIPGTSQPGEAEPVPRDHIPD